MLKSSGQTRRRILEAAFRQFFNRGFQSAAMQEIADAAGVTKRTIYAHFSSKDDLIAEVLAGQEANLEAAFAGWRNDPPAEAAEAVRCVFGYLRQQTANPDWRTSGFTRVAIELAWAPQHPARRAATRNKHRLESLIASVLHATGTPSPDWKARQIALLIEGAMVLRLIHGDDGYIDAAEVTAIWLAEARI